MDEEDIVTVYEEISTLTGQMLDAARKGDWDLLTELESQCSAQVDRLRANERPTTTDSAARDAKVRLINKILDDDREIRALTEPWMQRLQTLIGSGEAERKLQQAYGLNRSA